MWKDIKSGLDRFVEASRVRKVIYLLDKLWVRITVIGALSLLSILLARVFEPLIPDGVGDLLGAGSVEDLLNIIASSMIAATIFSLTVMVSIHRSASGQWTPRVHEVMMNDRTSQNVIATLMGAYIFALASLVFYRSAYFGEKQTVVLFVITIFVLVLIIFSIIRWAIHLQDFGSLQTTAGQVEKRAQAVLSGRANKQYRGGHFLENRNDVPEDARPIRSKKTGYVEYLLEDELDEAAEKADSDLYLVVEAGDFVFLDEILAFATDPDDALEGAVDKLVVISSERSFSEDPRLGFITLGEIGSRAMSPGVNDPGTAIDVLTRMARLLIDHQPEREVGDDVKNARLWVMPTQARSYFEEGILPVLRDGSGMDEVQYMGQRVLCQLSRHPDREIADAAKWARGIAMFYAEKGIERPEVLAKLREVGQQEAPKS
ncbi:MAG: DUF2254 domain-containing protein [Paracoccaceae bacterium]